MPVVFACLVPHPPVLLPHVGQGSEAGAQATIDAYRHLARDLAAASAETILIVSPHGPVTLTRFHILDETLRGDLGRFGAADLAFTIASDTELVRAIAAEAQARGQPLSVVRSWEEQDHACWVPLAFFRDAAPEARVVALSTSFLPAVAHYELGRAAGAALAASERRVAVIASADGSHALREDSPYGFHPAGPAFHEAFLGILERWDRDALLAFEEPFRYDAGEDCVSGLALLMGMLDGQAVKARVLSSEAPWGVGYTAARMAIGG